MVHFSIVVSCFSMFARTVRYFAGMTLSVKWVRCGSWNRGSAVSSKCLKLVSSTTLKGCNPRQIKSATASTNCLCFMPSRGNGVALTMVPGSVSCFVTTVLLLGHALSTGKPLSSRSHDSTLQSILILMRHT